MYEQGETVKNDNLIHAAPKEKVGVEPTNTRGDFKIIFYRQSVRQSNDKRYFSKRVP